MQFMGIIYNNAEELIKSILAIWICGDGKNTNEDVKDMFASRTDMSILIEILMSGWLHSINGLGYEDVEKYLPSAIADLRKEYCPVIRWAVVERSGMADECEPITESSVIGDFTEMEIAQAYIENVYSDEEIIALPVKIAKIVNGEVTYEY